MINKWRPNRWFNEYKDGVLEPNMAKIKAACLELGADRIIEALKIEGQFVNNDGSSPYGMVLGRTLKQGEKGYLVFIPSDK